MITRLRVSNYRSLEKVDITFDRLTALVGQNGSGKSNVMDAIAFVSDCMRLRLDPALNKRGGIQALRRWSSGHPNNIVLRIDLNRPLGFYEFTLTGDRVEEYRVKSERFVVEYEGERQEGHIVNGKWQKQPEGVSPRLDTGELVLPLLSGDRRFKALGDFLRRMTVYSIYPRILREPQKPSSERPMLSDGTNWTSILKEQLSTLSPEIVNVLNKLTGDIEAINIKRAGSLLFAQMKHAHTAKRHNKWFDTIQESDGTLRVAGIVTALKQTPTLDCIGLEEPELTVHPGALGLIVDVIKDAASDRQVILTTHSPDLLELLEPSNVRVVEKENGNTRVGRMTERQASLVRKKLFSVGELLRTEGLQVDLELAQPPVESI